MILDFIVIRLYNIDKGGIAVNEKKRPIIGVIGAEVSNSEQRHILKGIIKQAKVYNIDIAVFSNILNPNIPDDENNFENAIYDLAFSPELDGIIILSESFVLPELKQTIRDLLIKLSPLPMIAVGTPAEEFEELGIRFINTSDEQDFFELTSYLLKKLGFRNIDILTGAQGLEASEMRVNGYRAALEEYGIAFDESKVHYGTFWMNSGEELADKYITGELPLPEALICANDYMAYGVLDEFMKCSLPIPQRLSVIGYEYVWERIYHYPLLTTYQRNRTALGKSAVEMLVYMIKGSPLPEFSPPSGRIIGGASCPSSSFPDKYEAELLYARDNKLYANWNMISSMDRRLTNCGTIKDFVGILCENKFRVRYVDNIYLCLFENWYQSNEIPESDILSCYKVTDNYNNTPSVIHRFTFSRIFAENPEQAAYYFSPVFFGNRMFGYTILQYDRPDTYDEAFKSWIKSVSSGLEFMRMRNDIRYFTEYRNLSEQYDSLTGLYNKKGFEEAFNYACIKADSSDTASLIILKIIPPDESIETLHRNVTIAAEVAECLKNLTNLNGDICGTLEKNLYAFASVGKKQDGLCELLRNKLLILLMHSSSCIKEWGLDSVMIEACSLNIGDLDYHTAVQGLTDSISEGLNELNCRKLLPNYSKLSSLRSRIYLHPETDPDIDAISRDFLLSVGHFRRLYKSCFDVSFHQDCILARIALAKNLLASTSLDIIVIASDCGYSDPKYFMRMFRKNVGITPKQYREIFI